jgi:AraC-like DNA-binding protein
MELAHQVGLNDRKLKTGFREVFKTTAFSYLHDCRMERAQELLRQKRAIASVAAAVGYASPTAFNRAFQRKFGMSPKRYQLASQ